MAVKLSDVLKEKQQTDGVAPAVNEYERGFYHAKDSDLETKQNDFRKLADLYYDLVTDFYEFGWGRSFHFAPRVPGETFKASLARHEHFLALKLGLQPGMLAADIGCGIGGPLIEIARFSGANIVGVNTNAYQIKRAQTLTQEAGLSDLAEFLHCDFMNIETPDNTFDAVYDIEATCHAPNKLGVYSEVFRVLKPGGCFGAYEYCLTDRFDPNDAYHLKLKADIELGGSLLDIDDCPTVDQALHDAGFEVLETRDLINQPGPSIPWYEPLVGSGMSVASFRSTRFGRELTTNILRVLETLRVVPQGSVNVTQKLNLCAAAMAEAGRLGIFTPMYFLHGRKPE